MKKSILLAVFLACVWTPFLAAQNSEPQASVTPTTEVHAGIGVSLTPSLFVVELYSEDNAYTPLSNILIQIPIEFGKHFRIEPEFGYVRLSSEASFESGGSVSASLTNTRIGGGLFYLFPNAGAANGLKVALGVRLSAISASREAILSTPGSPDDKETWSRSDFLIAACIGTEYYISKDFSFGGEIQYNHYTLGDEDQTPESVLKTKYDITYTNFNGMITLRWFIW